MAKDRRTRGSAHGLRFAAVLARPSGPRVLLGPSRQDYFEGAGGVVAGGRKVDAEGALAAP